MDDKDDGSGLAVWAGVGIAVVLVLALVAAMAMRSLGPKPMPEPAAAAAGAALAAVDVMIDVPLTGVIVGRVFFDLDRAQLQPESLAALAPALQALLQAPGKKLIIAGFHDPSGDPAHNAELAKQRALAVRAALAAQGAPAALLQLRKPEQMALGGPPEEARRVEIRLVD
jgi:outer membrane protein OmpA-like peptidoglycan-associated protein